MYGYFFTATSSISTDIKIVDGIDGNHLFLSEEEANSSIELFFQKRRNLGFDVRKMVPFSEYDPDWFMSKDQIEIIIRRRQVTIVEAGTLKNYQ